MFFSSSNYRIASSLSARSAVDPEQWQTCLKQILKQKTSNQSLLITWPTPLTSTSPTISSPPSPSYNNTNSWPNKSKDSWTTTPTSWSKERVMLLPIEYPVFLAAPVIHIPSTSTQLPRPSPPPSYFSNHIWYLNQIVPGDIPYDAYNDGHFDDDYIKNDTYCDNWCPKAKYNMNTWGLNPVASNVEGGVMLWLFLTLNYYAISFTHCSDLIALDSPHMTYLLRSQSARLQTFPL